MAFVYPDSYKDNLLGTFVGSQPLRLFKNDHTPNPTTDTLANYTEADFSGYDEEYLSFSSGEIVGSKYERVSEAVAFTHNGGPVSNDVYGWYLVTGSGLNDPIRCAFRFADAPRTMDGIEDCIKAQITATGAGYETQGSGEELFDEQMEPEFDIVWNGTYYIRLYRNDYTPTATMVLGDFTQANFSGYGAENFGVPDGTLSGGEVTAQSPVLTYTLQNSTAQTLYGYYITNSSQNTIYGAERFASPKTLTDQGDFISFRLTFKVRTAYT